MKNVQNIVWTAVLAASAAALSVLAAANGEGLEIVTALGLSAVTLAILSFRQ